jgi:hypothetical protein
MCEDRTLHVVEQTGYRNLQPRTYDRQDSVKVP